MKIRVGIETGRKAAMESVRSLGIPVLISANALWDNQRKDFSRPRSLAGLDLALDSGGFVAMKRYGGYRWTASQYVGLAQYLRPAWWAQMDFCCEPEIASDSTAVRSRITQTVAGLQECQRIADGEGVARPMPVLQGWKPEDYTQGPIYEQDYAWPSLVGVGSVCRRQVGGPNGVMAVVEAINAKVPQSVQFHLFGVKSQAITALFEEFPNRVASMDSQAWAMGARCAARDAGRPCDNQMRADYLVSWYNRQMGLAHSPTFQPKLNL